MELTDLQAQEVNDVFDVVDENLLKLHENLGRKLEISEVDEIAARELDKYRQVWTAKQIKLFNLILFFTIYS